MPTKIEWATDTWNPVTGCTKVSEGCRNCYAEAMAHRLHANPKLSDEARAKYKDFKVSLWPERITDPFAWHRKPRRVFVCSMGDLFHEEVPFHFIDEVIGAIAAWQNGNRWGVHHQFILLTKRPDRMLEYFSEDRRYAWAAVAAARVLHGDEMYDMIHAGPQVLPNLWLLTSIEDQKTADERIPFLLQTPAAVRGVSVEPMLGPVDLGLNTATCDCCDRFPSRWIDLHKRVTPDWGPAINGGIKGRADPGIHRAKMNSHGALSVPVEGGDLGIMPRECSVLPGLDWVICGGESGPKARPMHPDWVRSLRDQCRAAGVPFMFKQWGEWLPAGELDVCDTEAWIPTDDPRYFGLPDGRGMVRVGKKAAGRLLDGVMHDEYPNKEEERE